MYNRAKNMLISIGLSEAIHSLFKCPLSIVDPLILPLHVE